MPLRESTSIPRWLQMPGRQRYRPAGSVDQIAHRDGGVAVRPTPMALMGTPRPPRGIAHMTARWPAVRRSRAPRDVLGPARQHLVDGLGVMEVGLGHRDLVEPAAVDLVGDTHRDLFPPGEDVQLGQEEVGQPVDAAGEPGDGASNQPQRRSRPVVTPRSPPIRRRRSPSSSCNSVGTVPTPPGSCTPSGIPITRLIRVGPMPEPVQAPPAVGLDDVTNGTCRGRRRAGCPDRLRAAPPVLRRGRR